MFRDLAATPTLNASNQVRWVLEVLQANEVLLYASGRNEPIEDTDTPSFVVCTTCSPSSKRLLPHNSASAFFVVIDVASGVAQYVRGGQKGFAICSKAGREVVSQQISQRPGNLHSTGQRIRRCVVNEFQSLLIILIFVHVDLKKM